MRVRPYMLFLFTIFPLSGCISAQNKNTAQVVYELITVDDQKNTAFHVSLKSKESAGAICIYIDHWPAKNGSVKLVDDRVKIIYQNGVVPVFPPVYARDCSGGCGSIRIRPNEEIRAVIPYSEFGDPKEIASLKNKRLEYSLTPYRCP